MLRAPVLAAGRIVWLLHCCALAAPAARGSETPPALATSDAPYQGPPAPQEPPARPRGLGSGMTSTFGVDHEDPESSLAAAAEHRPSLLPFAPLEPAEEWKAALDDAIGLKLGIHFFLLFQQASGGAGTRAAASWELCLPGTWTLVNRGQKDSGMVGFLFDIREPLTSLDCSQLGDELGLLLPTTGGFSERPFNLRQLYWKQYLFEDQASVQVGKIDPTSIYFLNRASDQNEAFLGDAISDQPAGAWPNPGLGASLRYAQEDWYVTAGFDDANAEVREDPFTTFAEGDYFYVAEAGYTPTLDGWAQGNYRCTLWYTDEAPNAGTEQGWGLGVSCDQNVTETAALFVYYQIEPEGNSTVRQSLGLGWGAVDFFGRKGDGLGFAASWGQPCDDDLSDEFILEAMYRLQLTPNVRLSPDEQFCLQPTAVPDAERIAVFSLRLGWTF